MDANKNGLHQLVQDVFLTRDDEIQCEEASVLTARCAQALLTVEESRRQYPALWRHVHFCSDCAAEYRLAMELAQLEADGELRRPVRIPSPPDESRSGIWARAVDALITAFPGFSPSPATAGAPVRGQSLAFEPAEVILGEDALCITFDVAANEQDTSRRDLFCTITMITAADDATRAALEGSPVWLQAGDDGPPVSEKALDELGDVAFPCLPPGLYTLRFHLARQDYIITDIVLP